MPTLTSASRRSGTSHRTYLSLTLENTDHSITSVATALDLLTRLVAFAETAEDPRALLPSTERVRWLALSGFTAQHLVVRRLSLASPLEIVLELKNAAAATGALAVIFYAIKRLYGIDLEFKAYREQRRIEFLEARRTADALQNPPSDDPRAGYLETDVEQLGKSDGGWKVLRGSITDESR